MRMPGASGRMAGRMMPKLFCASLMVAVAYCPRRARRSASVEPSTVVTPDDVMGSALDVGRGNRRQNLGFLVGRIAERVRRFGLERHAVAALQHHALLAELYLERAPNHNHAFLADVADRLAAVLPRRESHPQQDQST